MHRSKQDNHSITSSARPSRVIGTVRPSDFAVLRLITTSVFVDCWTGRSAGLSPRRMRPGSAGWQHYRLQYHFN